MGRYEFCAILVGITCVFGVIGLAIITPEEKTSTSEIELTKRIQCLEKKTHDLEVIQEDMFEALSNQAELLIIVSKATRENMGYIINNEKDIKGWRGRR